MRNKANSTNLILVAVLGAAFAVYLVSIRPESFGFYHDDSLYVVLARALATGKGYRIISLPQEPVETKSPPFYPLLLSLIWRINPHFPENVTIMMAASVLTTLSCLVLIWFYLTWQGYASKLQALLVVSLVAFNWRTIVLGTGIYSEMLYTALSVSGLYLAEEYETEGKSRAAGLSCGVLLGLAFLTRTAGITLLASVVLYFVLRRRLKLSLLPIGAASCFVLAWIWWSYAHRPTSQGVNAAYYESYFQTFKNVLSDLQAQDNVSALTAFLKVVGTNTYMLILISAPLICLGMDYDWPQSFGGYLTLAVIALVLLGFVFTLSGFVRGASKRIRMLHIYVVSYIGLHLVWPYSGQDRFLMPLLPFLLMFLIGELERLVRLVGSELSARKGMAGLISAGFVSLVLITLVIVAFYNYGFGIYRLVGPMKSSITGRAAEDSEVIRWINDNTDASDVLVCYRDPLYYLYTGRKAARSSSLKEGGKIEGDKIDRYQQARNIFQIISENDAKYLIFTSSDFELEYQADPYQNAYKLLLEQSPQVFVPVFRPSKGSGAIYEIHSDGR